MKKCNIVKKNEDFNRIIQQERPFKTKCYIIYYELLNTETFHFGISVGKKIGNAVIRNKIKRQVRNILDKFIFQKSFNCIIIVRKEFLNNSFIQLEEELFNSLQKIELTKEKKR